MKPITSILIATSIALCSTVQTVWAEEINDSVSARNALQALYPEGGTFESRSPLFILTSALVNYYSKQVSVEVVDAVPPRIIFPRRAYCSFSITEPGADPSSNYRSETVTVTRKNNDVTILVTWIPRGSPERRESCSIHATPHRITVRSSENEKYTLFFPRRTRDQQNQPVEN